METCDEKELNPPVAKKRKINFKKSEDIISDVPGNILDDASTSIESPILSNEQKVESKESSNISTDNVGESNSQREHESSLTNPSKRTRKKSIKLKDLDYELPQRSKSKKHTKNETDQPDGTIDSIKLEAKGRV